MLDELYSDIGQKMKNWAKGIFVVETILTILGAIITFFIEPEMFFLCVLMVVIGPLLAWISTWMLYGFGEIIDRLSSIDDKTTLSRPTAPPQNTYSAQNTYRAANPFYGYNQPSAPTSAAPNQPPYAHGWTCSCGRNHAPYESSCVCGKSRRDNL